MQYLSSTVLKALCSFHVSVSIPWREVIVVAAEEAVGGGRQRIHRHGNGRRRIDVEVGDECLVNGHS